MIKEDDQLNIDNTEMATLIENEINITTTERKQIIVNFQK